MAAILPNAVAKSGAAALSGRYALVDLETTGGSLGLDRIIEIGVVLYDEGEVREEWNALVNPGRSIPMSVQTFTGISDQMVTNAPPFAQLASTVLEKLAERIFVAHNARFDYGFLRAEFRRLGVRFRAPVLCTVRLSRRLNPDEPRHNLDVVMERHGLSCESRHRALPDARVLAGFMSCLSRCIDPEHLQHTIDALTEKPTLPQSLDPDLIDDLPDSPGVYRMYSEGELLCLSSAANIRSKVLAHFANRSGERDREFADRVKRIDWLETAGEIGARLAELRMRRELATGNTESKVLVSIALHSIDGWLRPAFTEFDPAASDLFGAFRRERDAEKALEQILKAHRLCRKMLGLEQAEGSCVGYQFGRCRGACVGKELTLLHNARLQLALANLKLKKWPFDGSIAVRERSWCGKVEWHVFDQWRHLGSTDREEECDEITRRELPPFDYDVFRLLARVLKTDNLRFVLLTRRPTAHTDS